MTRPLGMCCDRPARRTDAANLFGPYCPDPPAPYLVCDTCGGFCPVDRETGRPIGQPVTAETRRARALLLKRMIDPLWQYAHRAAAYENSGAMKATIQRKARERVMMFLSAHMLIPADKCEPDNLTLGQCREAWRILQGRTYPEIREWAKRIETDPDGSKALKAARRDLTEKVAAELGGDLEPGTLGGAEITGSDDPESEASPDAD